MVILTYHWEGFPRKDLNGGAYGKLFCSPSSPPSASLRSAGPFQDTRSPPPPNHLVCADGAGPSASSDFAARGAPWAWPRPGKRPRARRRASRTRRPTDDRVVPFLGRPTPSCDARRPRPKGQGWPGAWLCQLAHPMTPHRPALASSPGALATGKLSTRCSLGCDAFAEARRFRAGSTGRRADNEDARPSGNPEGRSAWGAPLCWGSSEMSPHRLLAPPRGASPGAGGAPEIFRRLGPDIPVSLCRDHFPGRGQTLT